MAFVNGFTDGTSVPHDELMVLLGLKTERQAKDYIDKYDIPFEPVNGKWIVAMEDVRKAFRTKAKTATQRRAEKAAKAAGGEADTDEFDGLED